MINTVCTPSWWIIDGPQFDKHTELVGTENRLIPHKIVKVVDDNGHKEIEHLSEGTEEIRSKLWVYYS